MRRTNSVSRSAQRLEQANITSGWVQKDLETTTLLSSRTFLGLFGKYVAIINITYTVLLRLSRGKNKFAVKQNLHF